MNLVCADVELHYAIMAHLGDDFFRDRYNVGIWAWELPSVPGEVARPLRLLRRDLGRHLLHRQRARARLAGARRAHSAGLDRDAPGRASAGAPTPRRRPDEFVFLFMFDFHSHMERKNPLAVIDAFRAAFRPRRRAPGS